MSILNILYFPDPRLRTKAKPVEIFDDALRTLIDDMLETMYAAPGVGLAATQVDVHKRLLVADASEDQDAAHVFINPRIVARDGVCVHDEGCLSFPGIYEEVERAGQVTVEAQDGKGKPFTLEVSGLLAVCVQHEIDHLDGKLFVDYISELKRGRIRKKMLKQQRQVS
ncbi:MAG: peptide deformylase [Gammaproteobacteria bacterium]|nr:MAG: peptide deformylase [Gammaproteobacteria bacterium]